MRRVAVPLLIAGLFFAAMAPTLAWLDFTGGSENLVVATALETHRTGHWLLPTLLDKPRIAKPPLPMWVSAAAMRPATLAGLSSPDSAERAAAFRRLGWEARWPALLTACLGLVATYLLARSLGGSERLGWTAALVCGSGVFFLRFGRLATTDVPLMLWVTLANACLASLVLGRGRWPVGLGMGVALGLAFMSKGPVAFVQTLLPAGVFVGWRAWRRRERPRNLLGPVLAGLGIMLLVGLPWYAMVVARDPGAVRRWWIELSSDEQTSSVQGNHWATYLVLVPHLAPWTVFVIAGAVGAVRAGRRRGQNEMRRADNATGQERLLTLFLVVVPVLVMSIFSDRKDRYLLPVVPAASVLAAWGIEQYGRRVMAWWEMRLVAILHWGLLALLAIGVTIAGAAVLRGTAGTHWYTWPETLGACGAFAAIIAGGISLGRAGRWPLVAATVAVMLLLQAMAMHGYRSSPNGRSGLQPLANAILTLDPSAEVYYVRPDGKLKQAPLDLPIYLNRVIPTRPDIPPVKQGTVVILMIQHDVKGKLETPPDPGKGWRRICDPLPRDRDYLYAFTR